MIKSFSYVEAAESLKLIYQAQDYVYLHMHYIRYIQNLRSR
jgi:CTP synthase (UTP-ammonia lyase)